jgi:hypothetical protein
LSWFQKKETGTYSAHRAALGGRTLKTGQSQCFVGYKKHTLRLWWRAYSDGVLLIPLVSWVAPANVSEGGLLVPSLQYCAHRWSWWPAIVVADMGYLAADAKRLCREKWRVAVVTKLRANMKLVPPFTAWNQTACLQGQRLEWLGYAPSDDLHWFGVTDSQPLCSCCWQATDCPRQFAHAPAEHETLLGLLPLSSHPAQRLLQQVRPWIEPAQSFEKNQLGLSQMFFNSLRLTWCLALLADAAVLLRTLALLRVPRRPELLSELLPRQTVMDFIESPSLNEKLPQKPSH